MGNTRSQAREICEDYLREQIRYNREHEILPSESAVAERLLAHGQEVISFYEEIYPALSHDGIAWKHMIGRALSAGAFWSTDRIAAQRAGRKKLEELNAQIAHQAEALADLLERRTALHNTSGFGDETLYAIYDVIEEASKSNGHFQSYLKEPLRNLSGQYDLKYWPSLADCNRVISRDAGRARVSADNSVTGAATHSSRPSKADVLRALLALIVENTGDSYGAIPRSFELSNGAIADLINALLELPPEEILTEGYVKTERHRFRSTC